MSDQIPEQFANVTVICKANIYFEGKVVSHTVQLPDGSRKTLGLIHPGTFHFTTAARERMEIIAGSCVARIEGEREWRSYPAGSFFDVPADSFFDIQVETGIAEYICSFN